MKRMMKADELARDAGFNRTRLEDSIFDPRNARMREIRDEEGGNSLQQSNPQAPDAARGLMHGIFTGEIQALEGAGRTCWDFDTGAGPDEVPFELKLDMARQCWDEARHVEISIKLNSHMGTDIGEYGERALLF